MSGIGEAGRDGAALGCAAWTEARSPEQWADRRFGNDGLKLGGRGDESMASALAERRGGAPQPLGCVATGHEH